MHKNNMYQYVWHTENKNKVQARVKPDLSMAVAIRSLDFK